MARVLLVKSRQLGEVSVAISPPLGIMYLASVLRQAGHDVCLIDRGFPDRPFGRLEPAIETFRPDVVGISAMTPEAEDMHRAASVAKYWNRNVPVVVGGPHAMAHPESILGDRHVDFLCLGEGEKSFPALVASLSGQQPVNGLAGVAYRDGTSVVRGIPVGPIEDVDSIPMPAWDLIDISSYEKRKSMTTAGLRRYMPLLTSRGCPYRCTYCHANLGKRFRGRSPGNVLMEIEALVREWHVRDFEICDDIFNWDLPRAKDILRRIAALPVSVKCHFPSGLRCDRLDDEFLALAKQAGVQSLAIAVETASLRLQRLCKKNLKIDRVRRVIDQAVDLGLYTRGFFMLGFPTETRPEMETTIRFAVESRLHEALFFTVIPFGGTELGERYPQRPEATRTFFGSATNLSSVPNEDLLAIQRSAYRRFYLNPWRIWHLLRRHPRPWFVVRYSWLAFSNLFMGRRRHRRRTDIAIPSSLPFSSAPEATLAAQSASLASHGVRAKSDPRDTYSPCPECGKILATRVVVGRDGFACHDKQCEAHGNFVRDLRMRVEELDLLVGSEGNTDKPLALAFEDSREHIGYSRDVWLDVTLECNLDCNICFANAGNPRGTDPSRAEIARRLATVPRSCQVTLTGGEPTLRSDLIELISDLSSMGFSVKLLTNGLRLQDKSYVSRLRDSGVQWVFLQFDGTTPHASVALRGRDLVSSKMAALSNLEEAGLRVGLGIAIGKHLNLNEASDLVDFAFGYRSVLHIAFVPIGSVGRHRFKDKIRATTAFDVFEALEKSSAGRITRQDFFFFRKLGGKLYRMTRNRAFQQIRCFHYVPVVWTKEGVLPMNRLVAPKVAASNLGRFPRWMAHTPDLLSWNRRARVGSPFRLVSIEDFFDDDGLDVVAANRCYKAYLTERGAVPPCIYNSYSRGSHPTWVPRSTISQDEIDLRN